MRVIDSLASHLFGRYPTPRFLASAWLGGSTTCRVDRRQWFVTAVREALQRVAEPPLVPDVPQRLNVRRFLLRRFPYSVVFMELDAEIRVLAIAHTSREPGFWRARL